MTISTSSKALITTGVAIGARVLTWAAVAAWVRSAQRQAEAAEPAPRTPELTLVPDTGHDDVRDLLSTLDAIRLGNAQVELDLPPIAGESWEGVGDLAPWPRRGYRDPMREGWLATAVELIWRNQADVATAVEQISQAEADGDDEERRIAQLVVLHRTADAERVARRILSRTPAWHPAMERRRSSAFRPARTRTGA